MDNRPDIRGIADIRILVDDFYDKVAQDELLAPIFSFRLSSHWTPHLEKMYMFWDAALFGTAGYNGNPFSKHATMDINQTHFDRWLYMFHSSVDSHFEGPVANEAHKKARAMADMFLRKITTNKNTNNKPIV